MIPPVIKNNRVKVLLFGNFKISLFSSIYPYLLENITPGSPSKFLMAAFVLVFAQKVTAKIGPMQRFVMCSISTVLNTIFLSYILMNKFSIVAKT